jgi:hypothetical protein
MLRGVYAPTRRGKPEQFEQEKAKRLLASLGARVWVAGTKRKKTDHQSTMQTPGLPDLPFVFVPRRISGGMSYELLVIEMKSPEAARKSNKGRSPEQLDFARFCELAGVHYFCGDCDGLIGWLISHGFLRADQVAADHTHANVLRD